MNQALLRLSYAYIRTVVEMLPSSSEPSQSAHLRVRQEGISKTAQWTASFVPMTASTAPTILPAPAVITALIRGSSTPQPADATPFTITTNQALLWLYYVHTQTAAEMLPSSSQPSRSAHLRVRQGGTSITAQWTACLAPMIVRTAPTTRHALVATTALTIASLTPQRVDATPSTITTNQALLWLYYAAILTAVETHQ